jgi:hypothetical protein
MRSEVTGDADTALETAAVALPGSRNERAGIEDRPDKRVGSFLADGLIHQLEVEVEVGDRVPADIRANEPSKGAGREHAGAHAAHAPIHAAPADPADRALKVGINGRRPMVLQQPADGPGGRGRPRIGQRIEVSIGQEHRLAISVDLPVFAIHGVRQTRIPGCVPGVGASEQDIVAGGEDPIPPLQVDLDAGVDAPADPALARVAGGEAANSAGGCAVEQLILHVDVVDHAGNLGLAPPLLDMQRANDVGPTLTAKRRGTGNTAGREDPSAHVLQAAITAGQVGAAAGFAVPALALCSERRREAAAKRSRVGHQDRFVEALLIGREEVVPVIAAADERVERLRLTSRDARPGHVPSIDIGEGAPGTVETAAEVRIEIHMTNQRAICGVRRKIKAEIGADVPASLVAIELPILLVGQRDAERLAGEAVEDWRGHIAALNHEHLRQMTRVRRAQRRRDRNQRRVRRSGVVLVGGIAGDEVRGHVTADLHAGVRARHGPAGDAANVANSNIFDRRRLPGRKISCLGAGDGDEPRRRPQQNALDERHV